MPIIEITKIHKSIWFNANNYHTTRLVSFEMSQCGWYNGLVSKEAKGNSF